MLSKPAFFNGVPGYAREVTGEHLVLVVVMGSGVYMRLKGQRLRGQNSEGMRTEKGQETLVQVENKLLLGLIMISGLPFDF